MNNQGHNNHFFDGFMLGIAVGAAAVFLFGTKSGKNLLKILSEQGLDGISNMMDEYNFSGEEEDSEIAEDLKEAKKEVKEEASAVSEKVEEAVSTPKKKFFKRFKK